MLIKREKTGLLQYRPINEYEEVVVFDPENNKIVTLEKKTVQRGEKRFADYILLAFIGMFLLGIANYIANEENFDSNFSCNFLTTVAVITTIPLLFFLLLNSPVGFLGGLVTIMLGLEIIFITKNLTFYRISSLLYCIVIIASLLFQ